MQHSELLTQAASRGVQHLPFSQLVPAQHSEPMEHAVPLMAQHFFVGSQRRPAQQVSPVPAHDPEIVLHAGTMHLPPLQKRPSQQLASDSQSPSVAEHSPHVPPLQRCVQQSVAAWQVPPFGLQVAHAPRKHTGFGVALTQHRSSEVQGSVVPAHGRHRELLHWLLHQSYGLEPAAVASVHLAGGGASVVALEEQASVHASSRHQQALTRVRLSFASPAANACAAV